MYDEIVRAVNRFTFDHEVEEAIMVLCNIMLDLTEMTDEDFANEMLEVVMSNSRFDLE